MEKFWGVAAGVVSVAGYVPYIRDILLKTSQPQRASWLIWSFQYSVLFWAQAAKGGAESLWLIGLQLAGVLAVSILSVRFGTGEFTRRTWLLLAAVSAGLVLWYFTSDAAIALLISIGIETIGTLLTVIKTYRDPANESLSMWICSSVAGFIGIFAISPGADPILYLYPASLVLIDSSVVVASWLGRQQNKAVVSGEELAE